MQQVMLFIKIRGVFMSEVNELVERAKKALEDFQSYTQEQIDYIVAKASVAAID